MGQYLSKSEDNALNFVNLPATAHRQILKYLKPWDLFKLSRTSREVQQLIKDNRTYFLKSLCLSLDNNVLSMRAELSGDLVFFWTFYDIRSKPYLKNRYRNKCHYQEEYEVGSYHENFEQAFLFAFRNVFTIFNGEYCHLEKLYLHSSKFSLFLTLLSFIESRDCEYLKIRNVKANDEDERNFSINFSKSVLDKLGVVRKLKLNFYSSDHSFECEKIYLNLQPLPIQLEDCSFKNQFDDVDINIFLKNWFSFKEKLVQSFLIKAKRNFNSDTILLGLETTPWDGRNRREAFSFCEARLENSVMLFREDGHYAIITIPEVSGNWLHVFGFLLCERTK